MRLSRSLSLQQMYLRDHLKPTSSEALFQIIEARNVQLSLNKDLSSHRTILNDRKPLKAVCKNYSGEVVCIGAPKEISIQQRQEIEKELQAFIPWRKGPFSVFGIQIDSEWQGHLKWNRISPHLDDLHKKTICDLGCNNGYYMYRMLAYNPELVLGIDPVPRFRLQFEYLQKFSLEERLKFEPIGFQELSYFDKVFDVIFCMGILYHHRNPIEILRSCWEVLKPKGQLVVESLGIPGHEPVSLFPEGRYANMKGVWFIPTEACLHHWLKKSGYTKIECHYNERMSEEEQRSTPYSPFPSFQEALHAEDSDLTREGYRRPNRLVFTARKT